MPVTPNYSFKTRNYYDIDPSDINMPEVMSNINGYQPDSLAMQVDAKFKTVDNAIENLESSQGILQISATLLSSSADLDTYTSTYEMEEYVDKTVILLSVDTTNIQTACININDLGFLYFKKYDLETNELVDLVAGDIKKDVKYLFQLQPSDNVNESYIILIGECPNDYCKKTDFSNVDNTADIDKPISNAVQTALDTKVDKVDGKSLISDTEITRLANVDNYDDSEIVNEINNIKDGTTTVGNAQKINNHIIESDVPENAVFTDTTYDNATTTKDGLMSSSDKINLNNSLKTTDTYSTLLTTDKSIIGAINENFTSVSNGKALIASAITDKGISTSSSATFSTMASNINNITTGDYSVGDFILFSNLGLSYKTVEVWSFTGHTNKVMAVAVDSNGYVYSGGLDETVKKISPTGDEVWTFTGHTGNIRGLAVDNNSYVYSGGSDNTVKKISPAGDEVWTFTGHTDEIRDLAVDSNSYVYSASSDKTVKKIQQGYKILA